MKFHSLFLTALTALSLTLGGCSNDDAVTAPEGDGDGQKTSFTISVSAGSGGDVSRADGENYDMGLSDERAINNVMIVIYDKPINYAGDDGEVVKVLYAPSVSTFTPSDIPDNVTYFDPAPAYYPQTDVLNFITVGKAQISDTYKKEDFEIKDDKTLEVGKRYYATALCNFGDMTSVFKGMSLKEFRNYIYSGALYDKSEKNIKGYSNFRMSGINETSFMWERKTDASVDLGDFLVQRLSARVDVMLGDAGSEFKNYDRYGDHKYIELAVYTPKADNANELELSDTYSFYLTDLKIMNNVDQDNAQSGMYLIERSSPYSPQYMTEHPGTPAPIYFDNEGWKGNFNNGDRKASKYIYSPSTKSFKDPYSLHSVAGYDYLTELINGGTFYFSSDFSNKKNSSVVGYLSENTNSSNYTMLRIEGYTDAPTSGIFTTSRAISGFNTDSPTGTHVVGEIPIMHSLDNTSTVMRYGVVRNTIYRLRIKVVATKNEIYFRYYYYEPGSTNSTQKPYTATAFLTNVGENDGNKQPD